MEESGVGCVLIVARVRHLGSDALCAFVVRRGAIVAAVNDGLGGEAIEHIQQHVRNGGVSGAQLCARDCQVTETGHGQTVAG